MVDIVRRSWWWWQLCWCELILSYKRIGMIPIRFFPWMWFRRIGECILVVVFNIANIWQRRIIPTHFLVKLEIHATVLKICYVRLCNENIEPTFPKRCPIYLGNESHCLRILEIDLSIPTNKQIITTTTTLNTNSSFVLYCI